jgi:hypothetical protein
VLQDIAVEPYLTVRETLARNAGYYPDPRNVDELLPMVGLDGLDRRKVKDLSGGQKRRLDLALGMVGRPRLLFLDEPTTGFDPSARRGAWQVIEDLRRAGTTILLTTHYIRLESPPKAPPVPSLGRPGPRRAQASATGSCWPIRSATSSSRSGAIRRAPSSRSCSPPSSC